MAHFSCSLISGAWNRQAAEIALTSHLHVPGSSSNHAWALFPANAKIRFSKMHSCMPNQKPSSFPNKEQLSYPAVPSINWLFLSKQSFRKKHFARESKSCTFQFILASAAALKVLSILYSLYWFSKNTSLGPPNTWNRLWVLNSKLHQKHISSEKRTGVRFQLFKIIQ